VYGASTKWQKMGPAKSAGPNGMRHTGWDLPRIANAIYNNKKSLGTG
jgi:hypothetical protein